jgi:uncharacterized protein (DUF427 family)
MPRIRFVRNVSTAPVDLVIEIDEDDHSPRFYFPRADVKMDKLRRTETTTMCPFKGVAHYYTITAGNG